MVLNPRHADIQPIFDAIPNYWQLCMQQEKKQINLLHGLFQSLMTRFLEVIHV